MKITASLILISCSFTQVFAQMHPEDHQDSLPPTVQPQTSAAEKLSPKDEAIERIFSTLQPGDVAKALADAKKLGVNAQVILEAHFLQLVDQENFKAIAQLAPELVKKRDDFHSDRSEIFAVKEDWLSIVHYAQALAALERNEKNEFKKHITEAFWLSPRQAQAFAPHINRLRLKESMASITLQKSEKMQPQDGSAATTLGAINKGKNATVLHFWSPMSQEVHQNLDSFIKTSQSCIKNNIAVVSILVGQTPFILEGAEMMRKDDASAAGCFWVVDPEQGSLANKMRIVDIPTMVIVSAEGKILFNGHPSQKGFWEELQKLAPELERRINPHEGHLHSDG